MRNTVLLVSALSLLLAACSGDSSGPRDRDSDSTTGGEGEALSGEDLLAASNSLGHTLLAHAPEAENALVSPASLTLALSSLGAGASNEAAGEFDQVLGAHGQPLLEAAASLATMLDPYDGEPAANPDSPPATPLVHVADHVVLDDELDTEQDYLDLLTEVGGAELSITDFGGGEAKPLLDEWVSHHTAGLIEESAIVPTDDMRLVIQNAVLFSARWATPFDPDMTFPRPFTAPSGQIEAESMFETLHVAYAEQDGWEAIALPYSEGFTSIVILPPGGSDPLAEGPEAVAARVESLKAALEAAAAEETVVQLPVLELSNTPALEPALESAGLGAIFTGDGDPFAAISAAERLFVSQASQQGVLIMNEEGTTAAAVTELGMEATSAPGGEPREFIVDRPYLLTISQNETGWDLFQAVIRNPAEQ